MFVGGGAFSLVLARSPGVLGWRGSPADPQASPRSSAVQDGCHAPVPGGRPQGRHREGAEPACVPHEGVRAQRGDRRLAVLVPHAPDAQDEEDYRGDPRHRRADGEERPHRQELRHLAPLRLSLRHAQHVPRVQGPYPDRRRGPDVLGDGWPPPVPPSLHPDHPHGDRGGKGHQAPRHPAVPQREHQVPAHAPSAARAQEEVPDYLQGVASHHVPGLNYYYTCNFL